MRTFKLYCISATLLTALLTAISVFLANVAHTEYKSQRRKAKVAKIEDAPFIDKEDIYTQKDLMDEDAKSLESQDSV